MNTIDGRFLEALRASLKKERVQWEEDIPEKDWMALFGLAEIHQVLPLIYEAVCSCPAAKRLDPAFLKPVKMDVIQKVLLQERKTKEALQLLEYLYDGGIRPLVVKGMVCRELYPKPDYRFSGDEDMLIPEELFGKCHERMLAYGMEVLEPEKDIALEYEIAYGKQGSALYIELHKTLFSPESEAYGDLNRFFDHMADRRTAVHIQGVAVDTMGDTDHLFYLICHAFKHFLHSGFGIRQVCDIVMFANARGSNIDWDRLYRQCREIHGEVFAAALFAIGKNYLVFSEKESCYPDQWKNIRVEERELLEDLLSGGVYGKADMERVHSSSITLHAVADQKKGKRAGSWSRVLRTVFPQKSYLEGRYPWLKKYPFLLPAAWMDRLLKYRKETKSSEENNAANSIRIGARRVELLKKYGVLR